MTSRGDSCASRLSVFGCVTVFDFRAAIGFAALDFGHRRVSFAAAPVSSPLSACVSAWRGALSTGHFEGHLPPLSFPAKDALASSLILPKCKVSTRSTLTSHTVSRACLLMGRMSRRRAIVDAGKPHNFRIVRRPSQKGLALITCQSQPGQLRQNNRRHTPPAPCTC